MGLALSPDNVLKVLNYTVNQQQLIDSINNLLTVNFGHMLAGKPLTVDFDWVKEELRSEGTIFQPNVIINSMDWLVELYRSEGWAVQIYRGAPSTNGAYDHITFCLDPSKIAELKPNRTKTGT